MGDKFEIIESILYKSNEGAVSSEFLVDKNNQTFWASQKAVADIFETTPSNISMHMQNIFQEGELNENKVCITSKKLFKDQTEFIKDSLINPMKGGRPSKWYNLDGIIAVGYRVNSKKATQFRQWADSVLKEYMIKGFVIDDELLINGTRIDKDYFDELLERIQRIRASERRFYQKVTDLFAECSYDYEKDSEIARTFYATVQNRLHFAITGETAAELINTRH
ncbi:MAG: RhuM family protein [Methanobacteriaceae archaeon]|nr:RhuM family protein [Methanobacteriaceae archaeon]